MKSNHFFLKVFQNKLSLSKVNQVVPLYDILQKMITDKEKRYYATQILKNYFEGPCFQEINIQKIINALIFNQISQYQQEIIKILNFFLLNYLKFRQSSLGICFIIVFCCIKQVFRINKKLNKIQKIGIISQTLNYKKKNFQIQFLKNIKTTCFNLLQLLHQWMLQQFQFTHINQLLPVTSFGKIQLTIQEQNKQFPLQYKPLCNFIAQLLFKNQEFLEQIHDKQNICLIKKNSQKMNSIKQYQENQKLKFVSKNNLINYVQNQIKLNSQKMKMKMKSNKIISQFYSEIVKKLPKSLKYINKKVSEKQKGCNSKEILDNFQQFYKKDKLNQKFPLLGQVANMIKNLIKHQNNEDQMLIYVRKQFKLWNLSLDLFRI